MPRLHPVLILAVLSVTTTPACAQAAAPFDTDYALTQVPPSVKELKYLIKVPDGVPIEISWVAESIGNAAPPNYELARLDTITKGPLLYTCYSRPKNGWPIGIYRLDFLHKGKVFHTVRFAVEDNTDE